MMRALRYAFDEALTALWRGRQSGLLSTATIALALFVLGGFLVVTTNLERLGSEWGRSAEMSVYLSDDITAAQRTAVEAILQEPRLVLNAEFVSKDAALGRFKRTFGEVAGAIDSLGQNPLPASFDVRLQPIAAARIEALSQQLRATAGVSDVRYDRQWLDRLLMAIGVIRGIGAVLGAVLTIAAALTVANVVRLSLFARRAEVDVMQLVGAPGFYVRGPFVMEGVLQGGIGALLALGLLGLGFSMVRSHYLVPLAQAIDLSSVRFLPVPMCIGLVFGGMLVGCVGGFVATLTGKS